MKSRLTAEPLRMLEELRQRRRDLVKTFGPALLIALIGFLIAFYFVEPPPPNELVVAAGPSGGNYYGATVQYAELFENNGVQLISRETAGSIENYDLLLNDPQVNVAIVQGGTAPDAPGIEKLESLAALYREPLWVVHRRDVEVRELKDLKGKRIAIGEIGSGTQVLSELLLNDNGVVNEDNETEFLYAGGSQLKSMLLDGEVDAGFLVLSAESSIVREFLLDPEIEIMDFQRAAAYARRYPFLKHITLERGVVDLHLDLPKQEINLIAPVASLVATPELHDAFIPLLIEAAKETHEEGSLVSAPYEMPSFEGVEFKVNPVARHYFRNGPSFLQRISGFWVASMVDRAKIMLVPLIVLLIPLIKLAPPVYRWRIRSRIYRWYALLRGIDQRVRDSEPQDQHQFLKDLEAIENELGEVNVPLSYMEEFYHLRLHIDLLKRRLEDQDSAGSAKA